MKYKTTITLCCLLAAFGLLMPATARALSLDLAVSISQPSLKVKSTSNNAVLGTLVSKTALWPSVALKTKEHYFGDSKFGYTAEMMAWYMRLDRQKVGSQEINMGTSARGYFAYLTPTLYYRFGDRYSMESPNWMASIGIGVGVGYLNVKGSIITTSVLPQTRQTININGIGLSSGLFFEIMKNRWFFRFTSFGPSLNTGSHNLELRDNAIKIGRSFAL
jgi:hypothetical protein